MFVFFQLFLSYFNVCLSPAFVVLSVVKKRHSALVAGHTISIVIFLINYIALSLLCWLSRFLWPCRHWFFMLMSRTLYLCWCPEKYFFYFSFIIISDFIYFHFLFTFDCAL